MNPTSVRIFRCRERDPAYVVEENRRLYERYRKEGSSGDVAAI
jgi:hypothetical protein